MCAKSKRVQKGQGGFLGRGCRLLGVQESDDPVTEMAQEGRKKNIKIAAFQGEGERERGMDY